MTEKQREMNIFNHFVKNFPLENEERREYNNRELFYFIRGLFGISKEDKDPLFKESFTYYFVSFIQNDYKHRNVYFGMTGIFNAARVTQFIAQDLDVFAEDICILNVRVVSKEEYAENVGKKKNLVQ